MKNKILLLLCLLSTLGTKAQTNEVLLDADGIMRVGAPVNIVTIGNSITAGYSNTSQNRQGSDSPATATNRSAEAEGVTVIWVSPRNRKPYLCS